MSTNQYQAFATGVGANVTAISTYIANTALTGGGYADGAIPTAEDFNRILRQACFGTAALGELIKANSVDALDDGDMATFVSHLKSAINTAIGIPSGTRMVFFQAAPPSGWTLVTTHNDKILRVVSGTGGGSGGTEGHTISEGCTVVAGHTHTYSGTTGNESNDHTHTYTKATAIDFTAGVGATSASHVTGGSDTTSGRSATHTHGYSGTTDSNSGTTWIPQYIDTIICEKT